MFTMRFANPPYTLDQLRALFEKRNNLLGEGKQGTVVGSEDNVFAIKRQSLIPSEQEVQHRVNPASGAYMAARVGQEALGPKVFQYEEDPVEQVSYLVMENLRPLGYRELKSVVSNGNEDAYRKLYAQQMILEARAARAGIRLEDTHNTSNVMFNPGTGDIMFIDQGFSQPYATTREADTGQVLAGVNGLRNLGQDEMANAFIKRMRNNAGGRIEDAEMANLAAEVVAALREHAGVPR